MRRTSIIVLSCAGLADAVYLWIGHNAPDTMVCVGEGCERVQANPHALLWGLPVAMYGALLYLALLVISVVQSVVQRRAAHPAVNHGVRSSIAFISTTGAAFSGYLTWVEAFVIHAWCVWCVLSFGIIVSISVLAWLERSDPGQVQTRQSARRTDFAAISLSFVIAAPLVLLGHRSSKPAGSAYPLPDDMVRAHLVRPDSSWVGAISPVISVVEFADFQCPGCREAQEAVRAIQNQYGSRIRFVFRNLPLASVHPYAEQAAEAAECAARQGRFWKMVDLLYAKQADLRLPAISEYAAEAGVDRKRFTDCLVSGKMAEHVRRDIADATALGIRGTPTFVVAGKRLEGAVDYRRLAETIEAEIRFQEGRTGYGRLQSEVAR